jgi:hypothetical protein
MIGGLDEKAFGGRMPPLEIFEIFLCFCPYLMEFEPIRGILRDPKDHPGIIEHVSRIQFKRTMQWSA